MAAASPISLCVPAAPPDGPADTRTARRQRQQRKKPDHHAERLDLATLEEKWRAVDSEWKALREEPRPPTGYTATHPAGAASDADAEPSAPGEASVSVATPVAEASPVMAARTATTTAPAARPRDPLGAVGRVLELTIVANWGDPNFVGLTSLVPLGPDLQPLAVVPAGAPDAEGRVRMSLAAEPADLNALPGHSGDVRTLDK
jgi:hypothetical protein